MSEDGDFLARIAEVTAAIQSLHGKNITVNCTREQYEQIMRNRLDKNSGSAD